MQIKEMGQMTAHIMIRGGNMWHVVLLALVFLFLFACCSHRLDDDVERMYSMKVDIPYGKMDKRRCSIYAKNRGESTLVLLSYIEEKDCSSCEVSRLTRMEKSYIDAYPDVEFVYIIGVKGEESEYMYRKLCDARVEGTVYLDTCNAFLSANPQFPSSPLLHTFVMDRHGKVLLVGNPFSGEKMKSMFGKIVEEHRNAVTQQVE